MKALVVLLLVLGFAACSGDDNTVTGPTTSAVSINGRVTDFFSRETIRAATIEFRNVAGSAVAAAATDGAGQYSTTLPSGGEHSVFVNGAARGIAYVGGSGYLGDLLIDDGTCVARYGTITDATGRPLAKATVSLGALSAVSAADGWYSIEFGCPVTGTISGNAIVNVSLPGYVSKSRVAGQNISGVHRLDVALDKP